MLCVFASSDFDVCHVCNSLVSCVVCVFFRKNIYLKCFGYVLISFRDVEFWVGLLFFLGFSFSFGFCGYYY